MNQQHFLYRIGVNGRDDIAIFHIRGDQGQVQIRTAEGKSNTSLLIDLSRLRDLYRTYKQKGWKDKATCGCGQEMDAACRIHLGQCRDCEERDDLNSVMKPKTTEQEKERNERVKDHYLLIKMGDEPEPNYRAIFSLFGEIAEMTPKYGPTGDSYEWGAECKFVDGRIGYMADNHFRPTISK
jgi:hypothetical protein